ncbi:hypothetical protein HX004_15905 [Myroides sp. 1354]|uniref:hypothetical protein n=1 Tax=unclassified Myroides TaxID=2642485 RepID=UPI0025790C36|nr:MULTISPECIES: hypothetical protein [unclassified Myroides]MDM1046307.1 hypothetical protein [Myroides sp. R163-1]MDM1057244.1 hypothetical protein [Myroides sp. 1354]MDM1070427.1 hypothetical protein [Myroides sp. 1372]
MKKLCVGLALAFSFGAFANTGEIDKKEKEEQRLERVNCYEILIYADTFNNGVQVSSTQIGTHHKSCTPSKSLIWYDEVVASYEGMFHYNRQTQTGTLVRIPFMPSLMSDDVCDTYTTLPVSPK